MTTPDAGSADSERPGAASPQPRDVHDFLGISLDEASLERVVVSVPVTHRVHQPLGLLHGGVSALLAESAASIGGAIHAGPSKGIVGIELNISHLRSVTEGRVSAAATPIRVGRTLQVWDIVVTDDRGRDVARSRCTLAVIDPTADRGTARSPDRAPEPPDRAPEPPPG